MPCSPILARPSRSCTLYIAITLPGSPTNLPFHQPLPPQYNPPYFPTPIHLAVADPDDEATVILQNSRKYLLNDKCHLPEQIILQHYCENLKCCTEFTFSNSEKCHLLLTCWGKTCEDLLSQHHWTHHYIIRKLKKWDAFQHVNKVNTSIHVQSPSDN